MACRSMLEALMVWQFLPFLIPPAGNTLKSGNVMMIFPVLTDSITMRRLE